MINKLLSSWGPKIVPTRARISDIAMFEFVYPTTLGLLLYEKKKNHTKNIFQNIFVLQDNIYVVIFGFNIPFD